MSTADTLEPLGHAAAEDVSAAPTALIVRSAGTNCDAELVRAFRLAGARTRVVHLDRLCADPRLLEGADLVGFPGGFSYGDDVASGRIFAARLRESVLPELRAAVDRGCPMIGVCNGFQVLVQLGLLPGLREADPDRTGPMATAALTENAGGRFIDRWVAVRPGDGVDCVWTRGLAGDHPPEAMCLPIAHGEGRFVTDERTLAAIEAGGQIALRYGEPVNGSMGDVAGLCDPTGLVFGLMPHPERYLEWTRHPFWTRLPAETREGETPGLGIFRGAVAHAAETIAKRGR